MRHWIVAWLGHARIRLLGPWLVVALVSLAEIEVWARDSRTEPWAQGVTPYQRFLLEPHLDAGFRFLRQGRHAEALKEFKRAKQIASTNPLVSLYLAQAYLANGDLEQAVEVLHAQRQLTPDHQEILATIEEYELKAHGSGDPAGTGPQVGAEQAIVGFWKQRRPSSITNTPSRCGWVCLPRDQRRAAT